MKRLLVIFLLLFSIYAVSQPGYTPGIVVTNNGDSLTGEINYREWSNSPETVEFRDIKEKIQTFDPASIKSFVILKTQEVYESFTVDVDMTPANSETVIAAQLNTPQIEKKRVFMLHLLNNNTLSLYFYLDNNKRHFYISTNKGEPTELIDRWIYTNDGVLHHDEAYKQQLKNLFADCPDVAGKTRDLAYLENPIRRLAIKFIKCVDPANYKEEGKERGLYVKFGIIAGIMHNSYKFSGTEARSLSSGEYKTNISPVIGVVADIGFRINNNKWFVVNELIYKQYKTSHSYFTHTVLYDYTTTDEFAFPYLQLNTMLRFRFPTNGSVKPYLNSGMGNGFRFAETKNTKTIVYSDGQPASQKKAIEGMNKYEMSIIFGAGVDIKNFQVEARYAIGNGFSPYVKTKSKVYSPQLIISYRF